MLEVKNIYGGYQASKVLFNVSFNCDGILALVGRNGMGKSTLLKSIMGVNKVDSGNIIFKNKNITNKEEYIISNLGIAFVPEGRRIFSNLNVKENILVAERKGYWNLDKIYTIFPRLKERAKNMGNTLSGGEQQMLSISRALICQPRLLLLDEATEGLAPILRKEIWQGLNHIKKYTYLIVVDKNIKELSFIADDFLVMQKGELVYQGKDLDEVESLISF